MACSIKPVTSVTATTVKSPNPQEAAEGASTTGNAAEKEASNGNAAQGANNAGQGGPTGQPSGDNAVPGGPSTQTGHCKAAITTLGASWYPPYSLYQIRGKLTCGGSGKTITLTSTKLSYVGKFGTAVTREDGYFSTNFRPGRGQPNHSQPYQHGN
jgi:hypothetical protein